MKIGDLVMLPAGANFWVDLSITQSYSFAQVIGNPVNDTVKLFRLNNPDFQFSWPTYQLVPASWDDYYRQAALDAIST